MDRRTLLSFPSRQKPVVAVTREAPALSFVVPLHGRSGRDVIREVRVETPGGRARIVAIERARRSDRPRPLIAIMGGPSGVSTLAAAAWLADPSCDALLDDADLLLLDPPGLGFSDADDLAATLSVESDADVMAAALTELLAVRPAAPAGLYLLGCGYGGARAVLVAERLAKTLPAARLAGLILLGTALNPALTAREIGNPIAFATAFPTLAARHWRDRPAGSLEAHLAAAEALAFDELLPALLLGDLLPDDRRDALAARMASLCGLPVREIVAARLVLTLPEATATAPAGHAAILERLFAADLAASYVARDQRLAQAWDWWSGAKRGDFDNLDLTPRLDALLAGTHPPQVLSLSAAYDATTPYAATRLASGSLVRQQHLPFDTPTASAVIAQVGAFVRDC